MFETFEIQARGELYYSPCKTSFACVCVNPEAVLLTAVMKGNRLTLAPLCLLLGWILPVDSFRVSGAFWDKFLCAVTYCEY